MKGRKEGRQKIQIGWKEQNEGMQEKKEEREVERKERWK